jgi:hypothetical protein
VSEEEADRLIDAMAVLLDLEIDEEFRPGVRLHLLTTARIAQAVLAFELPDEAEPAPVFEP